MSMSETAARPSKKAKAEHFDVLIVGAGISGIGGAYHLSKQCPDRSYVVLEGLESYGGTWLMHRYPGVRSDSDLYTFGYRFKPWVGTPIATADEILKYMGEVIDENDLGKNIRYRHKILSASWSTKDNLWTIHVTRTDTGEDLTFTANFLWMCQGYYKHAEGYTPHWKGMEDYKGRIVHPQTWPEDLDVKGKKVVCIGSGATAATVVPAIAGDAAHVTIVQRSPTYFIPARNAKTPIAPRCTSRRTTSRTCCASSKSTKSGSTRSCAGRSCSIRPRSRSSASRCRTSRRKNSSRA